MTFIREIQKLSPYLRVETLCRSAEGRDVPLVIIGNPLPASPLDAARRRRKPSSTSRPISTPAKSRARKRP